MKRKLLLIGVTSGVLAGCNPPASEVEAVKPGIALDTDEQRVSYGMGVGLGERIKQDSIAID